MRNTFRMGRVVGYSPDNGFMFYVNDTATEAPNLPVLASPSSYFFSLPALGAIVLYQDGDTLGKRYILTLNDDERPWYGWKDANEVEIKDPSANPSNLRFVDPGDTSVGRDGRAYFNGDVFVHSKFYRSKIFLKDGGPAELKAYDFAIRTEDDGISVYTEASPPEPPKEEGGEPGSPHFGDSLILKRRVPAAPLTETWLRLDHTGSATLSIMGGISRAQFDINGDIALECGTDGAEEPAPMAYVRLINAVKGEEGQEDVGSIISLFSETYNADINKAATLSCDSLTETVLTAAKRTCETSELSATKSILVSGETWGLTTTKASTHGCDTYKLTTGKTAEFAIGSDLTMNASGNVVINGASVAINSGEALAYKAALEKLQATVDSLVSKFNSHQHVYNPGPGPATLCLATITSATPSSLGKTGTVKTVAG